MKDGSPFGLAGLWENWRNPNTGEWERTFAIITVPSNELVAQIHNRMPAVLEPRSYERWLSTEADPHDLLITYPSEPMTMWPISTRVNKPENDDATLLDRTERSASRTSAAGPTGRRLGQSPSNGTSAGRRSGLEVDFHHSKPSDGIYLKKRPRNLLYIPKAALATPSAVTAARQELG